MIGAVYLLDSPCLLSHWVPGSRYLIACWPHKGDLADKSFLPRVVKRRECGLLKKPTTSGSDQQIRIHQDIFEVCEESSRAGPHR